MLCVSHTLKWIYRGSTVEIVCHQFFLNVIGLEMLDFVIDMGMDWWKPYYVDVDYQEKTVRFQFPGEVV